MRQSKLSMTQSLTLNRILVVTILFIMAGCNTGQVPDKSYNPPVSNPAFGVGEGPVVCLDESP